MFGNRVRTDVSMPEDALWGLGFSLNSRASWFQAAASSTSFNPFLAWLPIQKAGFLAGLPV
jgi:hypothetical protein